MGKKISVLVDLGVRRYAVLTEDTQTEKRIHWGGREHTSVIAGWNRKPDRSATGAWLQKQISCLPIIARLAKAGTVDCYFSLELTF